jgi:anaphase-promoting complex subunit 2
MLLPFADDSQKSGGQKKPEILKEAELSLYWNYTQSMLRNVGCLPLERIHAWLKMYASSEITLEQTKYLCDFKSKEQLLKLSGGLYRLNNSK